MAAGAWRVGEWRLGVAVVLLASLLACAAAQTSSSSTSTSSSSSSTSSSGTDTPLSESTTFAFHQRPYASVMQPAGDVIAAFDDALVGSGSFNVTLSFSSLAPNGLLFAVVGSEGDDHVGVQLLDTVVIGSVASNGNWALAQVSERGMRITDDAMHSLKLAWISELGELHLTLDEADAPVIANLTAQAGADAVATISLNGTIYLGNVPLDLVESVRYSRQPFFGCMMDVEVNGTSLVFGDVTSNSSLVTGECNVLDDAMHKCGPSTCSGNGACKLTQLGASCVCDPGFAAADCGTGMSRKKILG